MVPIISVVGRSNTGKTTLIEKLIPEFREMGLRVATIKHDVHTFEMDREGKDTWRHKKAGAKAVVIASKEKMALISDLDHVMSPKEIAERFFSGVDLVITEGFKRLKLPKIEVHRKETGHDLLCAGDPDLLLVASNEPLSVPVPVFDINDGRGIAMFVLRWIREN